MHFNVPIDDLGNARPLEKASVSVAAIGDNTLVAGATGRRVRLVGGLLVASGGANTVTISDGTTALTGAMDIPADGYLPLGFSARGLVDDTAAGLSLVLELTAATLVAGFVQFVVI